MPGLVARYARWLHTAWPAGGVETLPVVRDDGSTNVPGLYITGDLTGVSLLKLSSDSGARAVRTITADPSFARRPATPRPSSTPASGEALDLVIVGAGVSGMAAALEARKAEMSFEVLEAAEPFATIVNFPKAKPIYTYPTGMTPAGDLQFSARSSVKEGLLAELRDLTLRRGIRPRAARADRVRRRDGMLAVELAGGETLLARRVIVAIGRSGNFRRLNVPGEDLDKVYNRLHDPADFAGQDVVVVGGGDSALETAAAIAGAGGRVTLSYRSAEFTRPKSENVDRVLRLAGDAIGSLRLAMSTRLKEIRPREIVLEDAEGRPVTQPNDAVFAMIGREAPLDFFRRSGVDIRGAWRAPTWAAFLFFIAFCTLLFNWKAGGVLYHAFEARGWFPFNVPAAVAGLAPKFSNPATLAGTLRISLGSPGFYYSLAYCGCVVGFGLRRIRRRRTPYVTAQTLTLMAIQVAPLFLLPYLVLPWAGHNGWFDVGAGRWLADHLFPVTAWDPQGREYWRAFGLVLAWPLFIWNVFTAQPMWLWLAISFAQTFVAIPLLVYFWGKGAYCGWICSCGALAETLGDTHRHKMPHGRVWNRLNMVGQAILGVALVLLATRLLGWLAPGSLGSWAEGFHAGLLNGWRVGPETLHVQLNYYWWVDVMLAGIVGVGLYFWFSGRVWCRFACPLAALMHLYARFGRFRILSEKRKCISCNVCTSVCHQGIDVMSFANKGLPMADPQCVRCSACVQGCPTGTLTFGQVDPRTSLTLGKDRLAASPVQTAEMRAR